MKRALLSVSNRSGLVEFAQGLLSQDYEIIATGSTKQYLEDHGLTGLLSVEDVTGFEEMMDGRVKTLHPLIHGGLLGLRDNPSHIKAMEKHGIKPIDLVAVNLYPFKETIAKEGVVLEEAVEQIDIGGPSMLRSAAKNFRDVTVIIDPHDYTRVLEEISMHQNTTESFRRHLATKVYASTAYYDTLIAAYLNEQCEEPVTSPLTLGYELNASLRYGENPHQDAQFYASAHTESYALASAKQLHGKALSYNNIQDGNAALNMVEEFKHDCVCVAVKHMNPCAIACGKDVNEAFDKAYAGDPVSIFGGIVAFNHSVTLEVAQKLSAIFLEIILAPAFDDDALTLLSKKKNLRLLEYKTEGTLANHEFKSVNGGLLVQARDTHAPTPDSIQCVTQTPLDPHDLNSVLFAQKVVKHVKSNAIVVVKGTQTVGIGAGQMNRVGAAQIALNQAGDKAKGAVLASDAFFPMRDTVDIAAQYGIKTIIQPGGSIKDQESIDACNEAQIAMVITGERHFKH